MVALGTKPEYFNATWVKNEWSRYLALIKSGADKTLIPAYRDMDPYALPEEFSHLQALDMGSLGFMQDLTRGIRKLISSSAEQPAPAAPPNNLNALMLRAMLSLEEEDFAAASDFVEKMLDIDPQFAGIYMVKVLIKLKYTSLEEFASNCRDAAILDDIDMKRAALRGQFRRISQIVRRRQAQRRIA